MKNFIEKILYLWFAFIVFEAPLRYFFYSAGLPVLVYLKDLLLIIIFVYFALQTTATARINKIMLALLALICYGLIVGLINGLSFMQVAFGMKVVLTFFVGFMAVYLFGIESGFFIRLYRIFAPIILFGLVLEMLFELPWIGFEYDAYGVTIPGSIEWWTLGLPRLSGFGRVSYETAIVLFCLAGLYLTVNICSRNTLSKGQKIYDRLFLLLSFAGIALTTAKSSIFAFIVLLIFYIFLKRAVNTGGKFSRTAGIVIKILLIVVFLYGVVPPILAATAPEIITAYFNSDDIVMAAVSASYVERMEWMWPEAYQLLSDGYMYFTGRGLGGIGAPQKYFEPNLYNAADNVYVYLLVNFGIIILGLLVIWLLRKIITLRLDDKHNIYYLTFVLAFFAYGATLNVIESPTLMISLGFLLALWDRGNRHDN